MSEEKSLNVKRRRMFRKANPFESDEGLFFSTYDNRTSKADTEEWKSTSRMSVCSNVKVGSDLDIILMKVQKRMEHVRGFSLMKPSSRTNSFYHSEKKMSQKF